MSSSTPPPSASTSHPDDLVARLASPDVDLRLKSLREMKNRLSATVPRSSPTYSSASSPSYPPSFPVLPMMMNARTALIFSSSRPPPSVALHAVMMLLFAVVDAGSLPHLLRFLSSMDGKVDSLVLILSEGKGVKWRIRLANGDTTRGRFCYFLFSSELCCY